MQTPYTLTWYTSLDVILTNGLSDRTDDRKNEKKIKRCRDKPLRRTFDHIDGRLCGIIDESNVDNVLLRQTSFSRRYDAISPTLYRRYADVMPPLCCRYATVMPALSHRYADAMSHLFHRYADAMPLFCRCYADVMRAFCRLCAAAMPLSFFSPSCRVK